MEKSDLRKCVESLQYNLCSVGRMREEICLLKHELSYQCGLLTDEKRVIGVGGGGGIGDCPCPLPLPTFWAKLKKRRRLLLYRRKY